MASTTHTHTHTPTPWFCLWANSEGMFGIEAKMPPPPGHPLLICTGIRLQANAEFIVRACNAHDELLAVCEEVYQPLLDGSFYNDYDRATAMVGKLRNAIARATTH